MSDPLREAARVYDLRQAKLAPKPGEPEPFPATSYAEMKPEEWDWLWTGRFPLGEVSFLEGYAGDGKSSVCADLVCRVSSGAPLPGDDARPPAGVLWFTTEESPTKTIIKRLQLGRAKLANVRNVDVSRIDDETSSAAKFQFPSGRKRLSASVGHYSRAMGVPLRLIVVDGVFSIFDDRKDANKAQDVREVLGALRSVAVEHGLAIVCIRHPSKAKGGLAQHRAGGSTAWNDFVRMSWLVGQEPGTEWRDYRRVLVPVKQNAGRAYPGLKFHTTWDEQAHEVTVSWDDLCELSADEVYAAREERAKPKASDDQVSRAAAELRQHDVRALTMRKAKAICDGMGIPSDGIFAALSKLKAERRGMFGQDGKEARD